MYKSCIESGAGGSPRAAKRGGSSEITLLTEIFIYFGLGCCAVAQITFQIMEITTNVSHVANLAIAAFYFVGAFTVLLAGLVALVQARHDHQIIWFILLYVGSQASLWSPLVGALLDDPRKRIVYYSAVVGGGLITCLSIAMMRIFRDVKLRSFIKICIIAGVVLCHTVCISRIYGYMWIPFDFGVVLILVGYATGRAMSIARHDKHLPSTMDEDRPILDKIA